jgi:tryptophanyl-tRNA synthetase
MPSMPAPGPLDAERPLSAPRPDDGVLTGDRPTGALHLGHYAGSLRTRLALQGRCAQTLLIADPQALTDMRDKAVEVAGYVEEVALDYLAVGIDPSRTTIAVQSRLPALAELTVLGHGRAPGAEPDGQDGNRAAGFRTRHPRRFPVYPVSQAADITGFRATLVPVGEDQLPMIEQTNEVVRRLNRLADATVLPECRALLSAISRLPGVDGRKASKSLGNAIPLGASADDIRRLVHAMYTDPGVADPGRVEGNVAFAHLDAFDPDAEAVEELKAHYRRGGLGDAALKRRLMDVLERVIAPVRTRRAALARDRSHVREVLREGNARADETTRAVGRAVREVFSLGGP